MYQKEIMERGSEEVNALMCICIGEEVDDKQGQNGVGGLAPLGVNFALKVAKETVGWIWG